MRGQVHMTIDGPVALDIVQHFIERWNEVKRRKVSDSLIISNNFGAHSNASFISVCRRWVSCLSFISSYLSFINLFKPLRLARIPS